MRRPPARGREDLLLSPIRETRSGSPIREVPPARDGHPGGRLDDEPRGAFERRVASRSRARGVCERRWGIFLLNILGMHEPTLTERRSALTHHGRRTGSAGGAGGVESREMRSQATRNLLLLGGWLLGDRLLRLRREEGGARRENRAIWRGGRRGKRRSLLERAEIGRGKARGVRAARTFVRAVRRAGWGASPMRFGVGARARARARDLKVGSRNRFARA